MMEGRIRVTREGAVALAMLARGERLNAMDGAFFAQLRETIARLSEDGSVRAIVLAAEGRHFSAGLDLGWAADTLRPGPDAGRFAEAKLRAIPHLQAAIGAVEEARQPVIAALHGGCIGGGVDLASACDLRVMAADAFIQLAEIDVAITADLGTLQRLPHLIPGGIARELALTGRRMGAEEAARWGFANTIALDRDGAVAEAMRLAQLIAAKSPMAATGTKLSLNFSRGRPVAEGLGHAAMWNAATLASADLAAAIAARQGGEAPGFADLE